MADRLTRCYVKYVIQPSRDPAITARSGDDRVLCRGAANFPNFVGKLAMGAVRSLS
jgi:hypothetical protein